MTDKPGGDAGHMPVGLGLQLQGQAPLRIRIISVASGAHGTGTPRGEGCVAQVDRVGVAQNIRVWPLVAMVITGDDARRS